MNSMDFTGEDVKAGLMTQLIDYLCRYSYKNIFDANAILDVANNF